MMKLSVLPPLLLLCCAPILAAPPPAANLEIAGQAVPSRTASNIIFHPSSGSCVLRKSLSDPLKLGPCDHSDNWAYTPQKFLTVKGTYFCLQAVDSGKPARLGIVCSEDDSSWSISSTVKKQFSTKLRDGQPLCLDVDADNTLITSPCLCPSTEACQSENQLFEFTTRSRVGIPKVN